MNRVSEMSVFDSAAYKRKTREVVCSLFIDEIKKDVYNCALFRKSSETFHKQLRLISRKVSRAALTMEKGIFEDFSMRINDNLQTLIKFDSELELMELRGAYRPSDLCAYLAVLQGELKGMLDSLELSEAH
jgi:hypothetical protein